MSDRDITTIQVSKKFRAYLENQAKRGETVEDVVLRLIGVKESDLKDDGTLKATQ